jgi:arabinofuranosyltransferase
MSSRSLPPIERVAAFCLLALAVLLVLRSGIKWWLYTCDDTYVTCRYAYNVSAGHGPVFNLGERVEGYSSPFCVFLLALVCKLGGSPVLACKVSGFICALALPVLVFLTLSRILKNLLLAGIAAVWMAAVPELHIYMCSGMETVPFAVALAISAVLISLRPSNLLLQLGTMLSLVAVTAFRPEGVLLGPALLVVALLGCRDRRGRLVLMIFVVLVGGLLAMRWSYYGALLPNTYLAKPSTVLAVLRKTSLGNALWFIAKKVLLDENGPTGLVRSLGGIILAPVLLLGMSRSASSSLSAFSSVSVVVGAIYLTYCPEDWMPGQRFLFPFLVPALYLCALGISRLWKPQDGRYSRIGLVLSLVAVALWVGSNYVSLAAQEELYRSEQAITALYSPRYAEIGKWLRSQASPSDRVLAYEVGAVGYYSQLAIIDHEGLIDRYVAYEIKQAGGYRWVRWGMNTAVMWNVVHYCCAKQPDWYLARSKNGPDLALGQPVPQGICNEPIQNALLRELGPAMVLAKVFALRADGEDYYLLLKRSPR